MNREAYRRRWNRQKDKYEKQAARVFRRHLRNLTAGIPYDLINPQAPESLIRAYLTPSEIRKAYEEIWLTTGLRHGRRIGREINREIRGQRKEFSPLSFEPIFADFVRQWLLNEGAQNISIVTQTIGDFFIEYIKEAANEGKDIRTIARELERLVRSRGFYRWQIDRIVRTETTAAANFGALEAAKDSGLVLVKEWISSSDARTRRRPKDNFDHLEMDGVQVDENDTFKLRGRSRGALVVDELRVPGDPMARFGGSVINCRCSMVLVGKRDADGNLMFK